MKAPAEAVQIAISLVHQPAQAETADIAPIAEDTEEAEKAALASAAAAARKNLFGGGAAKAGAGGAAAADDLGALVPLVAERLSATALLRTPQDVRLCLSTTLLSLTLAFKADLALPSRSHLASPCSPIQTSPPPCSHSQVRSSLLWRSTWSALQLPGEEAALVLLQVRRGPPDSATQCCRSVPLRSAAG